MVSLCEHLMIVGASAIREMQALQTLRIVIHRAALLAEDCRSCVVLALSVTRRLPAHARKCRLEENPRGIPVGAIS
jgi:hypothetical protein